MYIKFQIGLRELKGAIKWNWQHDTKTQQTIFLHNIHFLKGCFTIIVNKLIMYVHNKQNIPVCTIQVILICNLATSHFQLISSIHSYQFYSNTNVLTKDNYIWNSYFFLCTCIYNKRPVNNWANTNWLSMLTHCSRRRNAFTVYGWTHFIHDALCTQ